MPERIYKSRQKIESDEVQGEGSWVVIRRPTWGDFQSIMNESASIEDINDVEVGSQIIENLVDDWNWVDDDGEPLPNPSPEIIRQLPFEEMQFLIGIIDIKEVAEKN